MKLVPTNQVTKENPFRTNNDGMFNASSLAMAYGKDVYGYTRSQKIKELVRNISLEYGMDPEIEFTDQGNIVRVISGGTAPGTWMHLDIFIKFLGWLDPKLERRFFRGVFAANEKQTEDPLQEKLARVEAEITTLKKKLARNSFYKDLMRMEKEAKQLQRDIEKGQKLLRKQISGSTKKAALLPQ